MNPVDALLARAQKASLASWGQRPWAARRRERRMERRVASTVRRMSSGRRRSAGGASGVEVT
ncbi:MAG: hypothetical protein IKO01_00530 [Kiritimatiellae bacterium]|nr:hypothetical protein [Kiritimatiellia bacterium]